MFQSLIHEVVTFNENAVSAKIIHKILRSQGTRAYFFSHFFTPSPWWGAIFLIATMAASAHAPPHPPLDMPGHPTTLDAAGLRQILRELQREHATVEARNIDLRHRIRLENKRLRQLWETWRQHRQQFEYQLRKWEQHHPTKPSVAPEATSP